MSFTKHPIDSTIRIISPYFSYKLWEESQKHPRKKERKEMANDQRLAHYAENAPEIRAARAKGK